MKHLLIITITLLSMKSYSQTFEFKTTTFEQTQTGFKTIETTNNNSNIIFKSYNKVDDNTYNTFQLNTNNNEITIGTEKVIFKQEEVIKPIQFKDIEHKLWKPEITNKK